MVEKQNHFGQLLRQARETAGLSRHVLAQRVGFNTSHIYRMEVGDRRPSRESVLVLAEALDLDDKTVNEWLIAAGYPAAPLLNVVRGAVRTRGAIQRPTEKKVTDSAGRDTARWTGWLEAMGLKEATIRRLMMDMDKISPLKQKEVATMVSTTFSRVTEALETPVHTAVIPAAGGQHRLLAPHAMQRLLLRVIGEATDSGISKIILVLAPGTIESLYTPIKEALDMAVVPSIKLSYCEQAKPEGLGDAILQAEMLVGKEPFAVLLPDDIVQKRIGRTVHPRELHRMMDIFKQLNDAYLVAVTPVSKSKMSNCGIAKVDTKEIIPKIYPIVELVEKPGSSHPIFSTENVFGIVGRYILQPDIFGPLSELKEKGQHPVELTDALEHLSQARGKIYAFELEATREDVGEVLGRASELIGGNVTAE